MVDVKRSKRKKSVKEEGEERIRDEARFAVSCMTGQQYKAEGEGEGEKEADQMERTRLWRKEALWLTSLPHNG